jgi:hypothetical protein
VNAQCRVGIRTRLNEHPTGWQHSCWLCGIVSGNGSEQAIKVLRVTFGKQICSQQLTVLQSLDQPSSL